MSLGVVRARPRELADAVDVAIVIDVLRATTTAIVLIHRGVPAIRVLAEPASLPPADPRYLYVTELREFAGRGDTIDNSPAQARTVALEGRIPVLVTTNGTRALVAAANLAGEVLVASFVNLDATVRYLRARTDGRIAVVPAGKFATGEARTEDDRCADVLAAQLSGAPVDLAAALEHCRADALVQRRIQREAGFAADLDIALSADLFPRVLRFQADGSSTGWIRACDGP
jgi:phosphosulfolactate phosphohydrolase-like enzyme